MYYHRWLIANLHLFQRLPGQKAALFDETLNSEIEYLV